jgi:tRNA-(ms[2]io[6]A)-hydroxylase
MESKDLLYCVTPDAWLESAPRHLDVLLIDHANCEKKAAGAAMNLMYRYIDKPALMGRMSRLAREELRHFEQLLAMLQRRGIDYVYVSSSRYAAKLRETVRTFEPARLMDILIVSAIVEARSCERFRRLTGILDDELADFYYSLVKSEARHADVYLDMARAVSTDGLEERLDHFLGVERTLIETPDPDFRFHSGVPAGAG